MDANDSPSVRKIWDGVDGLLKGDHPNVGELLRKIATEIEAQQAAQSAKIIPFPNPDEIPQ